MDLQEPSGLDLKSGDNVLLDGAPEDVARLARDEDLVLLAPLAARAFRRGKAPIALAVLMAVVIGAALDLALIYVLTSVLTEVVTNNAVAVIMTPIAVGVAMTLGLDPRAFVVAVMFGASASFATPIGYQTNTMVYNAGGYHFADFLRLGLPMNIIAGVITVLLAPVFWPFHP